MLTVARRPGFDLLIARRVGEGEGLFAHVLGIVQVS